MEVEWFGLVWFGLMKLFQVEAKSQPEWFVVTSDLLSDQTCLGSEFKRASKST